MYYDCKYDEFIPRIANLKASEIRNRILRRNLKELIIKNDKLKLKKHHTKEYLFVIHLECVERENSFEFYICVDQDKKFTDEELKCRGCPK